MKINIKKYLVKYGIVIFVFIAIFTAVSTLKVFAETSDSLEGWIWGGSDDGQGNSTGVGWISANSINIKTSSNISYSLNIPSSSTGGDLSGYAWSENIGWISFNASDVSGCPSSSSAPSTATCNAHREGDNINGWAKIKSIADAKKVQNSGGWSGWIKLSGKAQNGASYGVKVGVDRKLTGYAWSDELGWIRFDAKYACKDVCTQAGLHCIGKKVYECYDSKGGECLDTDTFKEDCELLGPGGYCKNGNCGCDPINECQKTTCNDETCYNGCMNVRGDLDCTYTTKGWREVTP